MVKSQILLITNKKIEMKIAKNLSVLLVMMFSVMTLMSCGDNSSAADKNGTEYTSTYICPMHCEGSGSDQPGACPVCGMDYVLNENHQGEGHDHDNHEGHNH